VAKIAERVEVVAFYAVLIVAALCLAVVFWLDMTHEL